MVTGSSMPRTPRESPWLGEMSRNGSSVDRPSKIRVAVIGVGHLGRHHARLLAGIEEAQLVAVVDTQADRAAVAAEATGARALSDYREVLGEVDAVSIAVPTELHRDVAMPFLERGTAVLVEKPITRTIAEG